MKYLITLLLLVAALFVWQHVTNNDTPGSKSTSKKALSQSLEQKTMVEDYEITIDIPYTNVEKIDVTNALKIELAKSELIAEATASTSADKQAPYTLEMIGTLHPTNRSGLVSQVVMTETNRAGTHGITEVTSITYSPTTGSVYDLGQIIDQNDTSIRFIFNQVTDQLLAHPSGTIDDMDLVTEGSGLVWDNYTTFYVTESGLTFVFDPYQVAEHKVGIVEASIAWEDLEPYLRGGIHRKLGFSEAVQEAATTTDADTASTTVQ